MAQEKINEIISLNMKKPLKDVKKEKIPSVFELIGGKEVTLRIIDSLFTKI